MPSSVSIPKADARVESARRRRVTTAARRQVRTEWFIENVSTVIELTMRKRVSVATQLLKDRVVRNISTPVVKGIGPRGGRVITGRSRPGEFPHAETTQLMKTIFSEVIQLRRGVFDGYVGTPLDYGLILETKMNRSFLRRTLNEATTDIRRILSGPIK